VRRFLSNYFDLLSMFALGNSVFACGVRSVRLRSLEQDRSEIRKNIFKKTTNYFYAVRISISLAILSESFIQIG